MTGMFTMDMLFLGHYIKQFESIGTADCEEVLFIPGLKIDYMIPGNPSSKRTYKVNKIAECPAKLRYV
jgi:hypothetical protein